MKRKQKEIAKPNECGALSQTAIFHQIMEERFKCFTLLLQIFIVNDPIIYTLYIGLKNFAKNSKFWNGGKFTSDFNR